MDTKIFSMIVLLLFSFITTALGIWSIRNSLQEGDKGNWCGFLSFVFTLLTGILLYNIVHIGLAH